MDQGAGGATEASLTPQPAPEVSGVKVAEVLPPTTAMRKGIAAFWLPLPTT